MATWWRVVGWALIVTGVGLAVGSVFVSIDEVGRAEDLGAAVEAGIILFALCLILAGFGFRLAFPDPPAPPATDDDEARPDSPRPSETGGADQAGTDP